jgi:excisionase family DNA binding protein
MSESGTIARPREVLTLAEAAAYLRVAEEELADLAVGGGIPARRIGGEWRFLRGALDDWLSHSGRHVGWPFAPEVAFGPAFAAMLAYLEEHLVHKLRSEVKAPRPGSKHAVLKHFGVFKGDEDLEERLADARARREEGG